MWAIEINRREERKEGTTGTPRFEGTLKSERAKKQENKERAVETGQEYRTS